MISKRSLLKGAMALPALAALPGSLRPAFAAQKMTGVTYLTPAYESLLWGFHGFVDALKEAGGGEIEVDFYDSGTLLSAAEQVSGLRSGLIDFMFHTTSYINGSFPILGVTGLPYVVDELFRNPDRLKIGSPLFTLIKEEVAKQNMELLSLSGGILEPDYLWSGSSAINSMDAISGKRIRVQGLEASTVLENLGAAVVSLPSSELYLAIQRGTIDGLVANVATVDGRRLQEQTSQVLKLPIGANTQGLFMLKSSYERLPDETKDALATATAWFDENAARHIVEDDIPTVWPKMVEAGVDVIEPSEADMEKFREMSEPIWETWKGQVGEEVSDRALKLALGQTEG